MADNWIKFKAQAVEDTINTLVEESKRQATADEYQKQMDQTTGKISVIGIYKVCAAAGKDIRTNDGYSQCRYFINQLAEKSDFGTKSANQANCANMFNGIWSLSKDGKEYQCVGKDGHKLVYSKSCDGDSGDCIKDFAGLKTQGPNGREFIAAWAKKKNIDLTCYIGFETRRGVTSPLGQDYIKCSAGGKSYEFEFDSLNETPGKTSMDSENKTICEFYGGKIVDTSDAANEKLYKSCDVPKAACYGDISSLASKTGHTVMYQGYCRLSREPKSKSIIDLKHIDGVDNRVFYNSGAQMRADMAKVQLEEYLHNTFPNEKYIVCDPAVKLYDYGLGLDKDYILTCTVGSKQVDFLFDDLSESSKSRSDTGMDAMQCIISGGTFKGESCRGPTPEECTKLDAALRAKGSTEGAKWDKDVRACILGNAMKTYKQDVATGYVVGAVFIVGGTIVSILDGGLTAPVVVAGAEMLVTDLAINYTIDWNHRRLSKQAANRFDSFMTDAAKCTDEPCALKVLEKHYATLSNVMNDLNTDDQEIIDNTMDNLLRLIQTEYVACGKNDAGQTVYAAPAACAMQSSTLRVIDYVDRASEPVLIIASVIYNPGYVTRRFMKVKTISKVAKGLDVSYKDAKRMMKAGEVVQDANGVIMRADDAARAMEYENRLRAAYKKYAPKNQSFDDFKKIFKDEAAFDQQLAMWEGFEPGYIKKGVFSEEFVPTPYSTYDPKLTKQLKAIDAEYADDIAKVEEEVKQAKQQFGVFKNAKEKELYNEADAAKEFGKTLKQADDNYTKAITQLEGEIKGLSGNARATKEAELQELQNARQAFRREQENYLLEIDVDIAPDWSKDNPLDPLLADYKDRRWNPRESDYTPEEWAYYVEQQEKDNLLQGYKMARDHEKNKIINASIPEEIAEAVAETRRQELIDIIANDENLFKQSQRYSELSTAEKKQFLQTVHDRFDETTHTKGLLKVQVYEDPNSTIVSNAARQYNATPAGIEKIDTETILETIVHEQGHLVDTQNPDLGMLGAQKAHIEHVGPNIDNVKDVKWNWETMSPIEKGIPYSKLPEKVEYYVTQPTEYSSFKTGNFNPKTGESYNIMPKIIEQHAAK